MRKTVVVISRNSHQHAPWKKQSNVPNQSRSNADITPMQAIPSDGHGVTRKKEGIVFEEVDSFLRPSTVVKVGQVKNLSTEMVHEAWLEKVIVGLTLSKTKASRVLVLSRIVKLRLWPMQFSQIHWLMMIYHRQRGLYS